MNETRDLLVAGVLCLALLGMSCQPRAYTPRGAVPVYPPERTR